ncbi:hypothetical protein B0T21DRAFT_351128 [Apiosordaria backusii]|uniref:Uncharacterized protein n=1 Tax=Apiosordaria backusii TaxID=314023 RepID=A0AA40E1X9_9PEZI|nr:hypothetical protein B0T21DRAFT_351128 [Apiosordaria backusii]
MSRWLEVPVVTLRTWTTAKNRSLAREGRLGSMAALRRALIEQNGLGTSLSIAAGARTARTHALGRGLLRAQAQGVLRRRLARGALVRLGATILRQGGQQNTEQLWQSSLGKDTAWWCWLCWLEVSRGVVVVDSGPDMNEAVPTAFSLFLRNVGCRWKRGRSRSVLSNQQCVSCFF